MARIELADVRATPQGRERVGAEAMLNRRPSAFTIHDLSLTVFEGETLVVLGPSGCGKTTLLKIIAGLIPPDAGKVRYDGVDMAHVRPGDRRIGMVFQNYALYPHMTVDTNLGFPLRMRGRPKLEVAQRVARDFRAGVRAGIVTTPTLFLDGVQHPGVPDETLLARLRGGS